MTTDDWLSIGIACLALLIAVGAFAAAVETAVALARRARLAQFGEARARVVERILEHADRVFRSARLVRTLVVVLTPLLGLWAAALVLPRDAGPDALSDLTAYAAAIVAAMILVPLVGQVWPRAAVGRRPEAFLVAAAPAIGMFLQVVGPLEWLLRVAERRVAPGAGGAGPPRMPHSEEEIKILVEGSAEQGVLEEDERDMIHSIFEFTDTVARKVMVPRIDMTCLQANTPIEEALTVVLEEGHSRIPCYEETVDSIVGIVHVKDLLRPLAEGRLTAPLREFMRQPYFVPEGKRLDELLRELKRERLQMAIVVDEYGGTSGLVTIEDILEEIVGDIQDEYDVKEPTLVTLDERTALVDGRMNIDDVNERLGLSLPTEEFESVGGFVFGLLGHVPAEGDRVPYDNLEFVIEKVGGNRIETLRVILGAAHGEGMSGPGPDTPSSAATANGG